MGAAKAKKKKKRHSPGGHVSLSGQFTRLIKKVRFLCSTDFSAEPLCIRALTLQEQDHLQNIVHVNFISFKF